MFFTITTEPAFSQIFLPFCGIKRKMSLAKPLTLVIDFETANTAPTSACSLGLVVLEKDRIVHRERFLIRPPTPIFLFTHIHGLTWEDVQNASTFGFVWKNSLEKWFQRCSLLVAHNVGFDYRVLKATAALYGIKVPTLKTECTVKLSRYKLGISPANLRNVSDTLGIELNHHEALSDALASAYIYLHVRTGKKPWLEAEQESLFPNMTDLLPNWASNSTVRLNELVSHTPLKLNLDKILALNSPASKQVLENLLKK
jgi:DNA polymerase-3 subunit epsilon